jgi:hypothetical protein
MDQNHIEAEKKTSQGFSKKKEIVCEKKNNNKSIQHSVS